MTEQRFEVIETEYGGKIEHRFHGVSAICPVDNQDFVDDYTITVRYSVDGEVAEVGSVKSWMDERFRDSKEIHLAVINEIGRAFIEELDGIMELMVKAETNQYRGVDNTVRVHGYEIRKQMGELESLIEEDH